LPSNRVSESVFALRSSERWFTGNFRLNCISILAALCLLGSQLAYSQEAKTTVVANPPLVTSTTVDANTPAEAVIRVPPKPSGKQPIESEIAVTGMIPAGDYAAMPGRWGWSTTVIAGATF
jgi:hypothetical protein